MHWSLVASGSKGDVWMESLTQMLRKLAGTLILSSEDLWCFVHVYGLFPSFLCAPNNDSWYHLSRWESQLLLGSQVGSSSGTWAWAEAWAFKVPSGIDLLATLKLPELYGVALQYWIESEEAVESLCSGGFMNLDDRLHQISQNLRLFNKGGGKMLPIK
jgi:hypothetical protein